MSSQIVSQVTEVPENAIISMWEEGVHCAFPDMIIFNDYYYCSFRKGNEHIPKSDTCFGSICIIKSNDLGSWKKIAEFNIPNFDLRDSKMEHMPDGRLMLLISGIKWENDKNINQSNFVSFSKDGIDFSDPIEVIIDEEIKSQWDFIGSIAWNDSVGYASLHQRNKPRNTWHAYLLKTYDGIEYKQITKWQLEHKPSEADLKFNNEGNLLAIVRVEPGKSGKLGFSEYPYIDWEWHDTETRFGGPELFQINADTLLIGSRYYNPDIPYHIPIDGREYVGQKTALFLINNKGEVLNKLFLPSSGDSSYPSILNTSNKTLVVCYYSSHEDNTSIYLFITTVQKLINKYFQ
jgi:hypothetical protein